MEGELQPVVYYEKLPANYNAVKLAKNGNKMTVTHRASGKVMEFER